MLVNIIWNQSIFNQLKIGIRQELEEEFKGSVYDMMFLTETLYFKINLDGDDFHSNDRLKILAVNFEHKTIECLIFPEKLNCVKHHFSP